MTKTNSQVVDTNRTNILSWYSGKALENAKVALDLLAQSEALGCWESGASRKVMSFLSKANQATKLGRRYGKALEAIGSYATPTTRGWSIRFILDFGMLSGYSLAKETDFKALISMAPGPELKKVISEAQRFANDFMPVVELVIMLNNARPKPVFTYLGVSPTVTNLLTDLGMAGSVTATVRVCPIRWEKIETIDKNGKVQIKYVGTLEWPAGTVHNSSRYNYSKAGNDQCQACGHAIKNPFNFVPLVIDDKNGVPHSLWTGKDCCQSLFGIKVTGDMEVGRN